MKLTMTVLDAAHWAPSSANQQPWRFIYTLKGSDDWDKFVSLLVDSNQEWAKNASALIFVVSKGFSGDFSEGRKSYTHSFDAGTAWGYLALQAKLSGLHTVWAASSMTKSATHSPFRTATAWKQELRSGALPTRACFRSATRSVNSPASASRSPKSPSKVNS
jgi:nitroreductase